MNTAARSAGNFLMSETGKKRILFLCTGNSCRSHMAEGWLRELGGDRVGSLSAGADPSGYVHPFAIRVMQEAGVDISSHRSKSIEEFLADPPELIVSVCEQAERSCPAFPGRVERRTWPFDDPARAEGSEDEKLAFFRRVRDEIREWIEAELGALLG